MAATAEVVTTSKWSSAVGFLRESYSEIKTKTTWPDRPQVLQASGAIIIFVLAIGLLISLLDVLLNLILVNLIPSFFA